MKCHKPSIENCCNVGSQVPGTPHVHACALGGTRTSPAHMHEYVHVPAHVHKCTHSFANVPMTHDHSPLSLLETFGSRSISKQVDRLYGALPHESAKTKTSRASIHTEDETGAENSPFIELHRIVLRLRTQFQFARARHAFLSSLCVADAGACLCLRMFCHLEHGSFKLKLDIVRCCCRAQR